MINNTTYRTICQMGTGTFATVFKAIDDNGKLVALKKYHEIPKCDTVEDIETLTEIVALKTLQGHPNVINMAAYNSSDGNATINIVLDLMKCSLKEHIDNKRVPESDLLKIMVQLTSAAEYMHSKRVMHRDIKPHNILVDFDTDDNIVVKLADFNSAAVLTEASAAVNYKHSESEVVTLWYRAPEVLMTDGRYTSKIDIWSLACVFFEVAGKGRPLFPGDSEIDQLYRIFRTLGTPNESTWPGVKSLRGFKEHYPIWPSSHKSMLKAFSGILNGQFLPLMMKILVMDPSQRLDAASFKVVLEEAANNNINNQIK